MREIGFAQQWEAEVARRIREEELRKIENVVRNRPEGLTLQQILDAFESPPPRRTLQYRLKFLVDCGRLSMSGAGRGVRYRKSREYLVSAGAAQWTFTTSQPEVRVEPPISEAGVEIRKYVRQPQIARAPVGYDRAFLDSYRPNATFYLSQSERAQLEEVGRTDSQTQPAGTYAKRILERLLIDLSWNSSRLEGNTYSLLDTTRLIEDGEEAEGKERLDAQMILNHKQAIELLVDGTEAVGFNRYTVLNLHAMLADNLLADPGAPGRLRHIGVGIGGSVFHPLEVPQLIEECFDQVLATASMIGDPFEQAFFAMVQFPYLQPFEDVNKRVSRLCANIPLIKSNLSPLTFADVPRDLYTESMLGVYELNRIDLLRDVFVWAYGRSAARYAAVRQSLGEPDPFRMRHRTTLGKVVSTVVRERMDKKRAVGFVGAWTREHMNREERVRFRDIAEEELLSLHEGSIARYRISPSEFAAWQAVWTESA